MSEQKISVQITADINGFKRQLTQAKQAMQRLDKDFDRSGRDMRRAFDKTESALDKQTNKIEKNFDNLSKDVKKSMDKLSKLKPKVKVDLNDNVSSGLRTVTRNLNRFDGTSADARVSIQDAATREINRVLSDLNRLDGERATPRVTLEGSAERKINAIRSDLNRLDGMRATPKVTLEGNAEREINGIRSDLNRIDGMRATPKVMLEGNAEREINGIRSDLNRLDGQRATPKADLDGSLTRQINSALSDMNRLSGLRALPTASLGGSGLRDISRFESALKGLDGRTFTAKARVSTTGADGSSSPSNEGAFKVNEAPFHLVSSSNLLVAGASRNVKKGLDDLDDGLERTRSAFLKEFKLKIDGPQFDVLSGELQQAEDLMETIRHLGIEFDGDIKSVVKRIRQMNGLLEEARAEGKESIELGIDTKEVFKDVKRLEDFILKQMDSIEESVPPLDFNISREVFTAFDEIELNIDEIIKSTNKFDDALEDVSREAIRIDSKLKEAFKIKQLKKQKIDIDVDFAKELESDIRQALKMLRKIEDEDVEIDLNIGQAKKELAQLVRSYAMFAAKAKTGAKTSISATADFSAIDKIKKAMASIGDETVQFKAVDNVTKQINRIKSEISSLADERFNITADSGGAIKAINGVGDALQRMEGKFQGAISAGTDGLANMASAVPGIGGALSGVVGMAGGVVAAMGPIGIAAAAAAVAVGAVGIAGTVAANDIDNMENRIRASLGQTKEEAKATGEAVRNAFKDGYGNSMEELAQAAIVVKQNMRDLDGKELEVATKRAETLNQVFGLDYLETVRTVKTLMSKFGISGMEAFDMITRGAQNGLNQNDDLLDTLNEYAPQFEAMGFNAEEFYSVLESGSQNGAWSLDKVGDAIKEFNIRIKDGSDTTKDAMKGLSDGTQAVWKSFLDGKATGAQVFDSVVQDLKGMDDQVKANQIGVGVFGTQWEDLEYDVITALNSSQTKLEDFTGSTDAAGQAMHDNLAQPWKELGRTIKDSLGEASQPLLEFLKTLGTYAGNVLPLVGNMFGGIGKAVLDMVPGLDLAKGAIKGFFNITKGMMDGFNSLFEEPKKASYDYSEIVSQETSKQIASYNKLTDGVTTAVKTLGANQSAVTKENSAKILADVHAANEQLKAAYNERYQNELDTMKTTFSQTATLTSEREGTILSLTQAAHERKLAALESNEARIKEVMNRASAEKRSLTTEEVQMIERINQDSQSKMVSAVEASSAKQTAILRAMKDQHGAITQEQAANAIQSSAKARDAVVKDAQSTYDQKVANAIYMRDELGTISNSEADLLIRAATKSRDEAVARAKDKHTQVVSEAEAQADGTIGAVDRETGEIVSKWDSMMSSIEENGFGNTIGPMIQEFFSDLASAIESADIDIWDMLFNPDEVAAKIGKMDWGKIIAPEDAYAKGKEAGDKAGDGMSTGVFGKSGVVIGAGQQLGGKLAEGLGFGDTTSKGQQKGQQFADGAKSKSGAASAGGQEVANALNEGIGSRTLDALITGQKTGNNFKTGVGSGASGVGTVGSTRGSEAVSGFNSGSAGAGATGSKRGKEASSGFNSGASPSGGYGKNRGSEAVKGFDGGASGAGGVGQKRGKEGASGFNLGMATLNSMARQRGSEGVSGISSGLSGASGAARGRGQEAVAGLTSGMSGTGPAASNAMGSASSSISSYDLRTPAQNQAFTVKNAFESISITIPKPSMPSIGLKWLQQQAPNGKGSAYLPQFFATGGIVTGATQAVIGEAGAEAVVPLSNKKRMKPFAKAVAQMMPEGGSGGGGYSQVEVRPHDVILQLDGKMIARQTVKYNQQELDKQTLRTNRLSGNF